MNVQLHRVKVMSRLHGSIMHHRHMGINYKFETCIRWICSLKGNSYGPILPKMTYNLTNLFAHLSCINTRCISRVPLTRGGDPPGFTNFDDILHYISDFWGCIWSPEAIKISIDSWDLPLQDFIHHVSRSGINGYYTVMPYTHMAQKWLTDIV